MLRGVKPCVQGHTASPVGRSGIQETVRDRREYQRLPVMCSTRWREVVPEMDRTALTSVNKY